MSRSYSAGPHTFDFDTHSDNGYNQHISINIKAHVYDEKLPAKCTKKLKQLEALEAGMTRQIEEWAWEALCEGFWGWARDEADARGLGKIHSEGRQGGHLVLAEYDLDRVLDICAAYESECELCHRGWEHHAKGECLFQSTSWKSINHGCLEELQTIEKFAKDIEELKPGWPAEYVYQIEFYVNDRWDGRPTEAELAATNRVRAWRAGACVD
jgi:hypothetical protein